MSRLTSHLRWSRAGRPTSEPVTVDPGQLLICRHGTTRLTRWMVDITHMDRALNLEEARARAEVGAQWVLVEHLGSCGECREES